LKQLQPPFNLFFSQTTAANHWVDFVLKRAYMDWWGVGVHDRVVARSHSRHSVHGMPLAACWRWIKNVCALAHD
jgi:hypothetical protein